MFCTSGKSYTVKAGDTLYGIAQQHLGDGKRWGEIQKADGTLVTDADAATLQPGQELCIPDGSGSSPSPSPSPSVGGMAGEILNAHNRYRAEVGVPPLTWSDTLASHAQDWANHLAANRSFEHSQGTGEGENLWKGTSGSFSYTQMVERWGNEKQYFVMGPSPNFSTTGNFGDVGHYTQMVWRNTTEVGCAIAEGADGQTTLVCRYISPGNVTGERPF
ncbi:hypothetical protein NIES2101_36605 [Calothrix sp. HK-06]|nr:hypothetical protein NIES2101_36605 [Calothrix sp. HK-06]